MKSSKLKKVKFIFDSLDISEQFTFKQILTHLEYNNAEEFINEITNKEPYDENDISNIHSISNKHPFKTRIDSLEKENKNLSFIKENSSVLMKVINLLEENSLKSNLSAEKKIEYNLGLIESYQKLTHIENNERLNRSINYLHKVNKILQSQIKNNSVQGISLLIFDSTKKDLRNLHNFLIEEDILKNDSDFLSHFIIKKNPRASSFEIKKIKWYGTMNELSDMFICLIDCEMLPETYRKTPFIHIQQHFCRPSGKDFENNVLSNRYREIKQSIKKEDTRLKKPYPNPVKRIRKIIYRIIY